MDLAALLARPESKTLEFKRDLSSPDRVLRTVVAFANTAGGIILLGIEDGTRRVRGVTDPVTMAERLGNLISHGIAPRVVPDIEILPWRRLHVVAVHVHPAWTAPHHLTALGPQTGAYVRVGASNRVADAALLADLTRLARNETFDEQPLPGVSVDAIDVAAARAAFAAAPTPRRLRAADLVTLRLVTRHQGREVPTVGGMLLFGTERAEHFPDAYLKVGRFDGTDRGRILDSADLHALPVAAVDEAMAFVQKHLQRAFVIDGTRGARRTERWTVPPAAVREAVVNAVVHADYAQTGAPIRIAVFDDRVEVDSPGLLPRGLTLEDVWTGVSKLRNRVIGRVFHELGVIEGWGSGVRRMRTACEAAGLRPPVLEEIATHFRVTLPTVRARVPASAPGRAPVRDRIAARDGALVAYLRASGGASTRAVASELGISIRTARLRLAALVAYGLVVEIGTSPTDPHRQYVAAIHPGDPV